MSTFATAEEIRVALRDHHQVILEQIGVSPINIFFPLDGEGIRIVASVRPEMKEIVPNTIKIMLDNKLVVIPIEVRDDYESSSAY